MKVPLLIVLLFCLIGFPLFSVSQETAATENDGISGTWKGTIKTFGLEIPVVVEIESIGNDRYKGSFLSPQHSQEKIPLSSINIKGRDVIFAIDYIQSSFSGKLSTRSGRIRGDWIHPEGEVPLELIHSDKPFEMSRPQNPGEKVPYTIKEVKIPNTSGDNVLAGTLTMPEDLTRPVPVVILLSDSGAHDRDGSIYGHKPFLVLADFLTRKGIAVLRYDERGTGESTGLYDFAHPMDFAIDAAAAFHFLKKQPRIDTARIGLIGHGEGATHAAIVSSKREDVAFLVLLGGHGLNGGDTILAKSESLAKAAGLPNDFIQLNRQFSAALFDVLRGETPDLTKAAELGKKFEEEAEKIENVDPAKLTALAAVIRMQVERLDSPWLRRFVQLDPAFWLERTTVPVLSINAANDLEVPGKSHIPVIEKSLQIAGHRDSKIETIPGVNHLFQTSKTGLPEEYDTIDETLSPTVLKRISDWILNLRN